ncbi:unnamed protein product [Gordionus sp. m RMFG-2023]
MKKYSSKKRFSIFHISTPTYTKEESESQMIAQNGDQAIDLNIDIKDYFKDNTTVQSICEHESKLYDMLPLFCKVFQTLPPHSMLEKMDGILQFAGNVSKLFVKEIKRRAAVYPAGIFFIKYSNIYN